MRWVSRDFKPVYRAPSVHHGLSKAKGGAHHQTVLLGSGVERVQDTGGPDVDHEWHPTAINPRAGCRPPLRRYFITPAA